MNLNIATTNVASGAASQNIELGMHPEFVKVTNVTQGSSIEYNSSDPVNTAGINRTASGTALGTAAATAGISLLTGDVDTKKGIVIGSSCPAIDTLADVLLIEYGFYDE